jgi:hypothetical protein
LRLFVALVLSIASFVSAATAGATRPIRSVQTVVIYADALAPGWENWSWNSSSGFANPTPAVGSASISVTLTSAWGALSLRKGPPVDLTTISAVRLRIYGGAGGNALNLSIAPADGDTPSTSVPITASAGAWTQITVTLDALGTPATLARLNVMDRIGAAQNTFFLDDIELLPLPVGQATPTPAPGPALSIDIAADRAPISPLIYGMNFGDFLQADMALAAELDLPVQRWGGNSVTRYNWQIDTINTANDYFFQNIRNENSNTNTLPSGSASDRFVAANKANGTHSIITVPMLGWVAKRRVESHPYDCGFSVTKYGAQQAVDPYDTDCGNGIKPDGVTKVTGNLATDTSIPVTASFNAAWVTHLVARFGPAAPANAAANGGVRFYNLDNEPMLWNSTHRDLRPNGLGYDELLTRTLETARAIKQADPGAQTIGPVFWGWPAYWYSAKDIDAGGAWYETRPDRRAHGDVPMAQWYLQQLRAAEQTGGQRLLDYFDLHFYPQVGGVSLSTAGDAATQAARLRSTRNLWDPAYADESWMKDTEGGPYLRLIPRMREWVDANYPGTKLALTEYNWGGLEHINGALAQADVLGIFGREGLDLATIWSPPKSTQPGAFAFRAFRNYDGSGAKFGDTRVRARSSDQGALAVYAAQRSSDGALTLVVINKSATALTSALSVAGLNTATNARVFRYSTANLAAFTPQPGLAFGVAAGALQASARFEANSITLIEVPTGAAAVTATPTAGTATPVSPTLPPGVRPRMYLPVLTR